MNKLLFTTTASNGIYLRSVGRIARVQRNFRNTRAEGKSGQAFF